MYLGIGKLICWLRGFGIYIYMIRYVFRYSCILCVFCSFFYIMCVFIFIYYLVVCVSIYMLCNYCECLITCCLLLCICMCIFICLWVCVFMCRCIYNYMFFIFSCGSYLVVIYISVFICLGCLCMCIYVYDLFICVC